LTKAAWTGLKLDKELAVLPVIGTTVGIGIIIAAIALAVLTAQTGLFFPTEIPASADQETGFAFTVWGYALLAAVGLLLAAVSTFVSGAVIHGALQRFQGNDPSIKSSIAAAWSRLGSLTAFAAFSFVIGNIISFIASRLPFIGGMVVEWLAGAAWNVASFFALPVIVSSDRPVGPVKATKGSIAIIKQVWGESLIANVGIGLIAFLTVILYTIVSSVVIGVASSVLVAPSAVLIVLSVLALIGLLVIALVFSMLSAYIKAAIYYFATTGESPVTFNSQLLRQAFTAKKARKVFSI
jgi:hypothetical protein